MSKCFFCDSEVDFRYSNRQHNTSIVPCTICGTYEVDSIFNDRDEDIVKKYTPYKHLISGLIREKNDLGLEIETITNENIMSLTNDPLIPKTIMQKLDKILLYYYRKSQTFGKAFVINDLIVYSIGYAVNKDEFMKMYNTLFRYGYFEDKVKLINFNISLEGMKKAEALLSTNIYSNNVFIAIEFKNDYLTVISDAIQPACKKCGFEAFPIINVEHNEGITDKIISEIKKSKFVIADFTNNNHGVYFEAGYAQGRGLEVIRTCKKDWFDAKDKDGNLINLVHFDIRHYNIILWDNYEDLKEKLINRIGATIL